MQNDVQSNQPDRIETSPSAEIAAYINIAADTWSSTSIVDRTAVATMPEGFPSLSIQSDSPNKLSRNSAQGPNVIKGETAPDKPSDDQDSGSLFNSIRARRNNDETAPGTPFDSKESRTLSPKDDAKRTRVLKGETAPDRPSDDTDPRTLPRNDDAIRARMTDSETAPDKPSEDTAPGQPNSRGANSEGSKPANKVEGSAIGSGLKESLKGQADKLHDRLMDQLHAPLLPGLQQIPRQPLSPKFQHQMRNLPSYKNRVEA